MRAVERVGDAQDRRQVAHAARVGLRERLDGVVPAPRLGLAVVARDERDDLHLRAREAGHGVALDQVLAVAVVAVRRDVEADVVQERRELEQLGVALGQLVQPPRLMEDRQRQARHVRAVVLAELAATRQLHHAAPPQVGELLDQQDARAGWRRRSRR